MIVHNPVLAGLDGDDRSAVITSAIADAHHQRDGAVIQVPGTARFVIGVRS